MVLALSGCTHTKEGPAFKITQSIECTGGKSTIEFSDQLLEIFISSSHQGTHEMTNHSMDIINLMKECKKLLSKDRFEAESNIDKDTGSDQPRKEPYIVDTPSGPNPLS